MGEAPQRIDALAALAARNVQRRPLPPSARFVLRGRSAAITAIGGAFGPAIPQAPCRAEAAGGRAALWLGPDEWLLLGAEAEATAIVIVLERAMAGHPHSLVDVSHRQVGLELSGADAETMLAAGCPLDLSLTAFPVGMCTRTLLGKTEMVLWRTESAAFRVEVARSFARYAWQFLEQARRDWS